MVNAQHIRADTPELVITRISIQIFPKQAIWACVFLVGSLSTSKVPWSIKLAAFILTGIFRIDSPEHGSCYLISSSPLNIPNNSKCKCSKLYRGSTVTRLAPKAVVATA